MPTTTIFFLPGKTSEPESECGVRQVGFSVPMAVGTII